MAQAVILYNPDKFNVGFSVDKGRTAKYLSPNTSFFPDQYIPPLLHTHSLICHRSYTMLAIDSVVKQQVFRCGTPRRVVHISDFSELRNSFIIWVKKYK
jgi:hypothetical protein